MTRAIRRHHNARLKQVRKKYYSCRNEPHTPKQLGIYLNTAALCSCWMCGNERKYFNRRTLKEISDIEMMKIDLKHYEEDDGNGI